MGFVVRIIQPTSPSSLVVVPPFFEGAFCYVDWHSCHKAVVFFARLLLAKDFVTFDGRFVVDNGFDAEITVEAVCRVPMKNPCHVSVSVVDDFLFSHLCPPAILNLV